MDFDQNDKNMLMLLGGIADRLEKSCLAYRKEKARRLRKLRHDWIHNPNDPELQQSLSWMPGGPVSAITSQSHPKKIYTIQNTKQTDRDFLRLYLNRYFYDWSIDWFITYEEREISNELLNLIKLWSDKKDLLLYVLER